MDGRPTRHRDHRTRRRSPRGGSSARGMSGDSIQRVVQPTVSADVEKAPALKFGQPRVMALFLALTLFQHLIDGFNNRDLRALVVDLLGVSSEQYTTSQMTYDLRRLRLKGLIFRPPKSPSGSRFGTFGSLASCWRPSQ